jgi:hypothetical protein
VWSCSPRWNGSVGAGLQEAGISSCSIGIGVGKPTRVSSDVFLSVLLSGLTYNDVSSRTRTLRQQGPRFGNSWVGDLNSVNNL